MISQEPFLCSVRTLSASQVLLSHSAQAFAGNSKFAVQRKKSFLKGSFGRCGAAAPDCGMFCVLTDFSELPMFP